MPLTKIDLPLIRERLQKQVAAARSSTVEEFEALQVVAYVMAGGGMIGRSAAEQPEGFCVDGRAKRRPYPIKSIERVLSVLKLYAEVLGYNPNDLPKMRNFHGCGVF